MPGSWVTSLFAGGVLLAVAPGGEGLNAGDGFPFAAVRDQGPAADQAVSIGCAWVDVDGDEWLDLFVANRLGPNVLYHNQRGTDFARHEIGALNEDDQNSFGCAWGDFDNDGRVDVYVTNHSGRREPSPILNSLYRNLGGLRFKRVAEEVAGPVVAFGGNSLGPAWADADGDGWLDLYVANWPHQPNRFFRGLGEGRFVDWTDGEALVGPRNSEGVSWADYDRDGDPDLFVANGSSQGDLLFRNIGGGRLERVGGVVGHPGFSSRGGAWGDYDHDGDMDLVVAHMNRMSLFRNDGSDGFFREASGPVNEAFGNHSAPVWGDYDNDGDLDLFIAQGRGEDDEPNSLFENLGDGTFARVGAPLLERDRGHSFSAAWGDFNNDGALDLYVTNGAALDHQEGPARRNFLYRNHGNAHSWLKVRCRGRVSNASGIGAEVRVLARIAGELRWQVRQISGGAGAYTGGQDGLLAHFGLADSEHAERLEVRWPSGIRQCFESVPADQLLTIDEPNPLLVVGIDGERVRLQIRGDIPGGTALERSSDLEQWHWVRDLSAGARRSHIVLETLDRSVPTTFYRLRPED